MQVRGYLIFHLNLAFSSIPEEKRLEVIRRCYFPLLELVRETGIRIGIELTGWTLERITELSPEWVNEFRCLLKEGRCELIGSGYTQLIGPLAPYQVNRWNQRLGLDVYQRELGILPKIALVNEMAFSSSMVDIYKEIGYRCIIMDRDNVRLALSLEEQPISAAPTHGKGPAGGVLPVLWADSILFQKLQHVAHGDIRETDYLDYIKERIAGGENLLPLYCNDAEIFDFRPGRFKEERPTHAEGEWNRLKRVLKNIATIDGYSWCSPTEAVELIERGADCRTSSLTSAAQPTPVKKQAKYNLSRWAVTGRNDTWLNTMCHRLTRRLAKVDAADCDEADVRMLCEFWSSDLRTHITNERWQIACYALEAFASRLDISMQYGSDSTVIAGGGQSVKGHEALGISSDSEGIFLSVKTATLDVKLNMRRGLAIQSMAFKSHDFVPLMGTLPHGYFSSITLGADYYSGAVVIELPGQKRRITDLERVEPELFVTPDSFVFRANIQTALGKITKTIKLSRLEERLEMFYDFPGWERPIGSVRVGTVTLLPTGFSSLLKVSCLNGGAVSESFDLTMPCNHVAASSSFVSCTTGFGATDGQIRIGDAHRGLKISWDPAKCAVLPMLVHKPSHPYSLDRLHFSLQEVDDTAQDGGPLGSFSLSIQPEQP